MKRLLCVVFLLAVFISTGAQNMPSVYFGVLDYVGCQGAYGWDAEFENASMVPYVVAPERVTVDISIDGVMVDSVTADQWRPDLLAATIGDGRHAFQYRIPAWYFDGMPHVIRAYDQQTGVELHGSPRILNCNQR